MTTKKASAPKKATKTTPATSKNVKPYVSILTPIYNEEESIPELIPAIQAVMSKLGKPWELIAVNDGSKDNSVAVLKKWQLKCPELRVVEFRRNYGQTAAMQAGFDHAQGEIWVTLDADLQNDPNDIPRLLEAMEKENADVVSGWRHKRQDAKLSVTWPSKVGNKVIGRITGVELHDYGCTLKAYRADAIREMRIYGELHRFIPAVAAQYGAKVIELPVDHHPRKYGVSKYGLDKTFRVILDLLAVKFFAKYLHRPMHAFGMAGLWCLFPGLAAFALLILMKLLGNDIGGRPLLIISVMLILIGVQLIGTGIIAEMITRVYHEPQGRKQYMVKK